MGPHIIHCIHFSLLLLSTTPVATVLPMKQQSTTRVNNVCDKGVDVDQFNNYVKQIICYKPNNISAPLPYM